MVEDGNGNVVARDEGDDDVPIVRFAPGQTGRYTVRVKMYACRTLRCYFGFGLFYR